MRKIITFNSRFYIGSTLVIVLATVLLLSRLLPLWLLFPVLCGTFVVAFWTLSSLIVSWYVYDCAAVTKWEWLGGQFPVSPTRWVNIHAGLDESTASLRSLFPGTEGVVIDIYDATEMIEPSIARARRMHPPTEPFITGKCDALPLPEGDRDLVFLFFAAHELRAPDRRTRLFREARRVLRDGGRVVLVEHLRDWANFVAFGPGFLHFHSERTWTHAIRGAGLEIERDWRVTPFVRCFVLRQIPYRAFHEAQRDRTPGR